MTAGQAGGKGKKKLPCIEDPKEKFTTKGKSPKSLGLCPESQPLCRVVTGGDDQQWMVVLNSKGERIWERVEQPRKRVKRCRPPPVTPRVRVIGGGGWDE